MKTLRYAVRIHAPVKQVWNTMLEAETYNQWVGASWPGSFYEGRWAKGEAIRFVSKDGSGTKAVIDAFEPHRFLSATHVALLGKGGVEDLQSEVAQGWIGIVESYRFNEEGDETELVVEIATHPAWEPMFNEGWPGALQALKQLSEAVPA